MKKQIIVIGGGETWNTYEDYINYLKNKEYNPYDVYDGGWKQTMQEYLGDKYDVLYIKMPSRSNAKYIEWKIWFEKLFPYFEDKVILVGHSLGANFLAKYLAENLIDVTIVQLHLVAGCFDVTGGFNLPESLNKVEEQCKDVFIYHSKDDCIVNFEDGQKYAKALPSAKFIKFENRNHFLQSEFPEIVQNIKNS
jgi:predicted alpha/beta hydrolase family esterase